MLSEEDYEDLITLTDEYEVTISEFVRYLIQEQLKGIREGEKENDQSGSSIKGNRT
jgi:hypothetical protein